MFEIIHDANLMLYLAKCYDNPQCLDVIEFQEDFARFKYIKRSLNKFKETGEIKERLIINHLVILYNVFGVEATNRVLFLKLNGFETYLIPFLIFMNTLPVTLKGIGIDNKTINISDYPLDNKIVEVLRKNDQ